MNISIPKRRRQKLSMKFWVVVVIANPMSQFWAPAYEGPFLGSSVKTAPSQQGSTAQWTDISRS